ncbi:GtrA family protein [Halobacteriaceae archaeon GCM10025711]
MSGDTSSSLLDGVRLGRLASPARFVQFAGVGAVGMVWDVAVLALLHGQFGVPLLPAKVASAETSIALMFLLNERVTFATWGASGWPAVGRRFLTSNLVRLGGLAVGTGVLLALVDLAGVWYVAANVVGIGAGFLVNYTFENLLTWRVLSSGA